MNHDVEIPFSRLDYTHDQVTRIKALLDEWPPEKLEDALSLIRCIGESPDFLAEVAKNNHRLEIIK